MGDFDHLHDEHPSDPKGFDLKETIRRISQKMRKSPQKRHDVMTSLEEARMDLIKKVILHPRALAYLERRFFDLEQGKVPLSDVIEIRSHSNTDKCNEYVARFREAIEDWRNAGNDPQALERFAWFLRTLPISRRTLEHLCDIGRYTRCILEVMLQNAINEVSSVDGQAHMTGADWVECLRQGRDLPISRSHPAMAGVRQLCAEVGIGVGEIIRRSDELDQAWTQYLTTFNNALLCHLPLVAKIALTHYKGAVPIDDVIQEGILGLIRALELYNPRQGVFSSYATHWITHHVRRAQCEQRDGLALNVAINDMMDLVYRTSVRLMQELGRDPTTTDLKKALRGRLSENDIDMLTSIHVMRIDDLKNDYDTILSDDLDDLMDHQAGWDALADIDSHHPERYADLQILRQYIEDVLARMPDQQAQIIRERIQNGGDQPSLQHIAQNLGISKSGACRQVKAASKAFMDTASKMGYDQIFRDWL